MQLKSRVGTAPELHLNCTWASGFDWASSCFANTSHAVVCVLSSDQLKVHSLEPGSANFNLPSLSCAWEITELFSSALILEYCPTLCGVHSRLLLMFVTN
jgi:hypothetical protein